MRRITAVLFVMIVSLAMLGKSHAFLDFFKKDLEKVPETAEMRAQEAEANLKVTEALEYEAGGKTDKAFDLYRGVVRKYPLTTSAAMSQYKVGEIQKNRGDYSKAFDSFQKFVEDYKQSSAFDAAIASQYEIARASQTGEHKETFIGIPRKVQPSEVLAMYRSVIDNAPYSEYAPQAQFAIGEVLEEDDKDQEAVVEYKKVVASYPRTKLAADAQFRIGEIGAKAIEDGSQNIANVNRARGAFEDLLLDYGDDLRRDKAQSRVIQFNELEARKAFEVGRFYEKRKKYRSAALYYRRVSNSPGTSAAAEAAERLAIVEAKIPGEAVSEVESPQASVLSKPVEAVGGAAAKLKKAIPQPKFGSRLFGRKRRAQEEADAAQLAAQTAPAPGSEVLPDVGQPSVVAAAANGSGGPSASKVAAVVPGATKLTKRKGYYGPPAPDLALGKKENKMRIDLEKLPDLPFGLDKLDQEDLDKGLKILKEELPEDLSSLVVPPAPDEEGGDKLKVPPPVEDEAE